MSWRLRAGKVETEANRKRSEAAKVQENRGNQYSKPSEKVEVNQQSVGAPPQKDRTSKDPGAKAKATESKTNQGAVQRGDQLYKERPDLAKKVMAGAIKPAEALIKDDPQALRMFRREVVAEPHKHKADSDNITIKTPTSDDKGKRAKQDNSDNITIKPPTSDDRGPAL
jgi:hypothetical protein